MATKIVKLRLITWFEEVPNPAINDGSTVLAERINHMGDEVTIEDDNPYLQRLEDLGAFYTDEEAEEIKDGSYDGSDADILNVFRSGQLATPAPPPSGEGPKAIEGAGALDVNAASAEDLGEYIRDNKLTVSQTLGLVPADADEDMINKFLDAENYATQNSPRAGVERGLEAQLNASTTESA